MEADATTMNETLNGHLRAIRKLKLKVREVLVIKKALCTTAMREKCLQV